MPLAAATVRPPSFGVRSSGRSPTAHLVGARGSGMKALSELLGDLGWTLTGSDLQHPETLQIGKRTLQIHQGHAAGHVSDSVELLIYSPAIAEDNPERVAARERAITELSYVEALARLMSDRNGIAISGTHGKTTTTAMVASILRESGANPAALIGGEVLQYGRSGWAGSGDSLVVEACEYRRHFLGLSPQIVAILNIEPDHFDCFATLDDAQAAFAAFIQRLPEHGRLIVRSDVARVLRESLPDNLAVETFSISDQADWTVHNIEHERGRYRFEARRGGEHFSGFSLVASGRHNVENALAAVAVASASGVNAAAIAAALSRFQGVHRRLNVVGEHDGVTLVDDYAHHPTAISATLATVREMFPGRRVVTVFQPHQVSRTSTLLDDFAASLAGADEVVLVPVFAARESQAAAESCAAELERAVLKAGCPVRRLASLDQVLTTLHDSAGPDDVWLTLGAGDIDRIPHEFARHIS